MHSGTAKLSAPITLVQITNELNKSFLILLPIYRTAFTPVDPQQRQAELLGWSYAPLLIHDVLGNLEIKPEWGSLELTDITTPSSASKFYQSNLPYTHTIIKEIDSKIYIYGRTWQLKFFIYPSFVKNLHLTSLKSITLGGSVFSLGSALLVFFWISNRRRHQQLSNTQKQLASIVESSIDGIIGSTLSGVVISWNQGAERLFGYSANEAIGKKLEQLIVPAELCAEEQDVIERLRQGQYIDHFETQRQTKSGQILDVSVSVSSILSSSGEVLSVSKTIRDISRQKKTESDIHRLNTTLEQQVELRTYELDEAQRTLRTVLDALPSMIGYWDKDLIIRVANQAYHDFFNIASGALLGRSMPSLLGAKVFADKFTWS